MKAALAKIEEARRTGVTELSVRFIWLVLCFASLLRSAEHHFVDFEYLQVNES